MGNSNTIQLTIKTRDDGSVVVQQYSNKAVKNLDKIEKKSTSMSTKMGSGLKALKAHWMAFTAAIAGAVMVVKGSVGAFLEQEKAENKLAVAMKNYGDYTKESHKAMLEFASDMQKLTTYGDEVSLSMMANLKTYGMNNKALKAATKATMDLASAKGMDLFAASELVGKAFVGETGSLSRYGIVLKQGVEDSKKFEAVLGLINDRFGGSAQADIETYSGQLKQMSNWWGDITEKVGFGLIKALEAVLGALGWVSSGFLRMISSIQAAFEKVYGIAAYLPGKAGKFFKTMSGAARDSAKHYDELSAKSMDFAMKNFKMMVTNAKSSKKIVNDVAKDANDKLDKLTARQNQIIQAEQAAVDIRRQAAQEMYQEAGINAEAHYRSEVQQLTEKAALWKQSGVDMQDINQYMYDRITEMETAAFDKGEEAAADWLNKISYDAQILVENFESAQADALAHLNNIGAKVTELDGSKIGFTVSIYDQASSGISRIIKKLEALKALSREVSMGGGSTGTSSAGGGSTDGGGSTTNINVNVPSGSPATQDTGELARTISREQQRNNAMGLN